MTRNKIDYSHMDYIVIVNEIFMDDFDMSVHSFNDINCAKKWINEDIKNFLKKTEKSESAIFSSENYWDYEDDDYRVSWEIREIHHRTTGEWEDTEYQTEWNKV